MKNNAFLAENKLSKNGYYSWIDILKGIGICCMVYCHINEPSSIINKIIFTFHMPLFFVASGICFKNKNNGGWNFVKGKFLKLMPQYFFSGFIVFLVWFLFQCPKPIEWTPFSAIFKIFKQTLFSYLYGIGQVQIFDKLKFIDPCGPAWFIPCLFVANCLFYFIHKLSHGKIVFETLFIVVFVGIGIFIGKYIYLPWSIDIALVCVFFVFVGYHLKDFIFNHINLKIALISFVLYVALFFVDHSLSLNNRAYGIPFVSFPEAIFGLIALCYICQKIDKKLKILKRIFVFLGKNSNIFLLFHLLFLNNLWENSVLRANSVIFFFSTMFFCSMLIVFIKSNKVLSRIFNIKSNQLEKEQ